MNPRPILNTPGGESSPITEILCPSRASFPFEVRRRTHGQPDAQFSQLPINPGIRWATLEFCRSIVRCGPNWRPLAGFLTPQLGSGRAILPRLPGTRTREMLDDQLGLTSEQQAQNLLALQRAEFRPWELSPDLIAAGLWIVYALFALMWCRTALRQNEGQWRAWARERILVPV